MTDFVMPKLGSDMTAGTLVSWAKKPGDAVHHGEIIAEVETEKGVIGIEIFSSGVIEQLTAKPGERVAVGSLLATIREEGQSAAHKESIPAPHSPRARHRISPSARALADQIGVRIDDVLGTGPEGAITREDVERSAKSKVEHRLTGDRGARMRQTIASAMSRAKREIPHYYLSTTIDLHPALTWLEMENQQRSMEARVLPAVLLIKATALALREVPELNAIWEGDHARLLDSIHVGLAISLRAGGLIAPAIHNTDHIEIGNLMTKLQDLVARARAGAIRSSELADPTITVSNLGERGVEAMFPIIYPPQVAIVGFGKIVERPWVVGGQVVPRRVVAATLAADHRVTDGHRGAIFLAAIDRLLQEPAKL